MQITNTSNNSTAEHIDRDCELIGSLFMVLFPLVFICAVVCCRLCAIIIKAMVINTYRYIKGDNMQPELLGDHKQESIDGPSP